MAWGAGGVGAAWQRRAKRTSAEARDTRVLAADRLWVSTGTR